MIECPIADPGGGLTRAGRAFPGQADPAVDPAPRPDGEVEARTEGGGLRGIQPGQAEAALPA